jgi:hypothetical protein
LQVYPMTGVFGAVGCICICSDILVGVTSRLQVLLHARSEVGVGNGYVDVLMLVQLDGWHAWGSISVHCWVLF